MLGEESCSEQGWQDFRCQVRLCETGSVNLNEDTQAMIAAWDPKSS